MHYILKLFDLNIKQNQNMLPNSQTEFEKFYSIKKFEYLLSPSVKHNKIKYFFLILIF